MAADGAIPLKITGYQVLDDTLVVSVRNESAASEQGFLSLLIQLPGGAYVAGTTVVVPAASTVPVSIRLPSSPPLFVLGLEIDRLAATADAPAEDEGNAPGSTTGGGSGHSEGNQITEGPDTVGR